MDLGLQNGGDATLAVIDSLSNYNHDWIETLSQGRNCPICGSRCFRGNRENQLLHVSSKI